MTNKELFDMINKGLIAEVLTELANIFPDNDELAQLDNEYGDQPNNFKLGQYMNRLKRFITKYNKESTRTAEPEELEEDYYKLLCALDFKLQTDNFLKIYQHKKIAAFLLHGDTDEEGNDLRWLCNQMLHEVKLFDDKITIDFNSNLGSSYERLLDEFYARFKIDVSPTAADKPIVALRYELEERLKTGPFVCIIQSSHNILKNEPELCKLHSEFLDYMNENIARKNHKHPLVILFIHEKPADYVKELKYFFWFTEDDRLDYSLKAFQCKDMKIIDLAPIDRIQENDITTWIAGSMKHPKIFEKTSALNGQESAILKEGNKPYQVIKKICSSLDIKFQDKWILK